MTIKIISSLKKFLQDRFNLNEDKADEMQIIEAIRRDVPFQGTNLWTLIFAILIASIGLNVNSTAVIIGAMLISPLMGPIMGMGLGMGINDAELLKKAIKNMAIATFISIGCSALYFFVSPIHEVNSELLARTNPSLWDVFIAFFGGLAGIVAGTRKEKTNVIPGMAIATALMPPLCTAGFGLATGQWYYLLGAFYLFFINSFFICLATFLIVKHLGFQKKQYASALKEKRVTRTVVIVGILTILPSIYLAYGIVQRSIFEGNAKSFVKQQFAFRNTQVVSRKFNMDGSKRSIELLLVGQELSPDFIDSLQRLLPKYNLNGAKLVIHQGLNAKNEIDLAQIKASILEDVFKKEEDTIYRLPAEAESSFPDLRNELNALYPGMTEYSLERTVVHGLDSLKADTITLFTARYKGWLTQTQQGKLSEWLKQRVGIDSLKMIIEQGRIR